jgi:hypothetical protein
MDRPALLAALRARIARLDRSGGARPSGAGDACRSARRSTGSCPRRPDARGGA